MGTCYGQLDDFERETIQSQLEMGWRPAAIAAGLERSRSTVTRELRRNGWKRSSESSAQSRRWGNGGYVARRAGQRARQAHRKPRVERKLVPGTPLWDQRCVYLRRRLSPFKIASTLLRMPDPVRISHETIYTALYAMPRGELRTELLRQLRRKRALLKALLISSYFDEYTLCRIERAAVQGFIDKSTNTVVELGAAIKAIEDGSTYFPSMFTEARRAHVGNPLAFDKVLTDREQTILGLIGEPLSDAEIAAQLKLSPETVEKHRFNIMRKLGLGTRAESARFARRCGLTRPAARRLFSVRN